LNFGHMLMALGAYFRCHSNNYVEAQAFKIGILVIQMIKDDIGQIQACGEKVTPWLTCLLTLRSILK